MGTLVVEVLHPLTEPNSPSLCGNQNAGLEYFPLNDCACLFMRGKCWLGISIGGIYCFYIMCLKGLVYSKHTQTKRNLTFGILPCWPFWFLFVKAISAETPNTEMNGIPCAAPSNEKLCAK